MKSEETSQTSYVAIHEFDKSYLQVYPYFWLDS